MENNTDKQITTTQQNQPLTVKSLFAQDSIKKRFQELLGSKMQGFVTSVLQCVASNDLLSKAEPHSVLHAAAVAATLDLPLNNSLGMAYIVPYNVKQEGGGKKVMAQFQMGYKAFIQLAQRSGQFKTINATEVREGEIKTHDRQSGEIIFEWIQGPERTQKQVIGYIAYFKLLNGFEKSLYMTSDELKAHGQEYSQSFKKGFGLWKDKFDAMASKTVLKLLLSKYAPLSIAMQTAVIADQAIINNSETLDITHVDNTEGMLHSAEEEYNELFELFELKKSALSIPERKDAERIIKDKEQKSFKKLHALLKSK